MADMQKPLCGGRSVTSDDVTAVVKGIGILIAVIAGAAAGAKSIGELENALGALAGAAFDILVRAPAKWVTGLPGGLIITGAIAGGVATFIVVLLIYRNRCSPQVGTHACSFGVVEEITPSFNSVWDELFPFSAMHPRADVVVASRYWNWAVFNNAPLVRCASGRNCPPDSLCAPEIAHFPDAPCSPELACYWHSEKVCRAAAGATVGAAIGALIGTVIGTLTGMIIGAIDGCALILPCLALAIFIAAAVAGVVTLVGAFVGGQIGRHSGPGESQPMANAQRIQVGDYITTEGNLISSGFVGGANAYWWVGWEPGEGGGVEDRTAQNDNGTILCGHCMGGSAPFCYTDPDSQAGQDGC